MMIPLETLKKLPVGKAVEVVERENIYKPGSPVEPCLVWMFHDITGWRRSAFSVADGTYLGEEK